MIFVHQLAGLDHEECMHERKKIAQSLGSSEFVLEGSNGALEPFVTVLAVTKTVTSSIAGWGFSEKMGNLVKNLMTNPLKSMNILEMTGASEGTRTFNQKFY